MATLRLHSLTIVKYKTFLLRIVLTIVPLVMYLCGSLVGIMLTVCREFLKGTGFVDRKIQLPQMATVLRVFLQLA